MRPQHAFKISAFEVSKIAPTETLLLQHVLVALSGSNATPLVSRYSCRATLVSHFSPDVFVVSHEARATPLKVSQKRRCRTLFAAP